MVGAIIVTVAGRLGTSVSVVVASHASLRISSLPIVVMVVEGVAGFAMLVRGRLTTDSSSIGGVALANLIRSGMRRQGVRVVGVGGATALEAAKETLAT